MSGDHNQFQKPKSYLDDMNEVRKVLEMALIALEDANDMFSNDCSVEDVYADEIEALTKVLEKESFECPRCGHCCYVDDDDTSQERVDETAKQEHEPVVWASSLDFDDDDLEIIPARAKGKLGTSNCNIPLYTAPPKQWVGLTDEEIDSIDVVQMKYIGSGEYVIEGEYEFARAIEAKLKEKNT